MADDQEVVLAHLREAIDQIDRDGQHAGEEGAEASRVDEDADYRKAKSRALNMLAARDHSRHELAEKLARKEHEPATIERLLDALERSRLLDDEAFAESFARAKRSSRALGKSALGLELKKKGVSGVIIQEVLAGIDDEDEIAAARRLVLKKASSSRGLDRETRLRRLVGMLARRGYRSSLAYAVVTEVLDHEAAPDD